MQGGPNVGGVSGCLSFFDLLLSLVSNRVRLLIGLPSCSNMGDKNKNLLQLQQKTPSGSGGFGHQRVSLDEDLSLSIATSLSLITASYGLGVVLCQFPSVYDLEVFRSENGSHRIVPYSFCHPKLENQLSTSFLRGFGGLEPQCTLYKTKILYLLKIDGWFLSF